MADSGLEWFMLDGPEFVHSDAFAITGVPELTLQNWANRKLIDIESSGKGKPRIYTSTHIAMITFAREMIAIGLETGLALSAAASIYMALLRRLRDSIKSGKKPDECERIVLESLAFVAPDKEKFKHKVELIDLPNSSYPLARGLIFLPAGPLLAKAILAALNIENAKQRERKANPLSAAAVGAVA